MQYQLELQVLDLVKNTIDIVNEIRPEYLLVVREEAQIALSAILEQLGCQEGIQLLKNFRVLTIDSTDQNICTPEDKVRSFVRSNRVRPSNIFLDFGSKCTVYS